jgi:hypothetical protein
MGLLGWLRARDYRHRVVTAILYLNDAEWAGGGALRCFDTPGGPAFRDVAPVGGTVVLFDAGRVEHEVQPPAGAAGGSARYALTCWVNGVAAAAAAAAAGSG